MSHLQYKSDTYEIAMQLLHDKCLYPAVAHPAYYSCFQLYRHIGNVFEINQYNRENSHNSLIDDVTSIIMSKNNKKTAHRIKGNVMQLKRLRNKADYDEAPFTKNDSEKAIKLTSQILPELKKYINEIE
jgi:uncharacterized protein (UPF0332 family)